MHHQYRCYREDSNVNLVSLPAPLKQQTEKVSITGPEHPLNTSKIILTKVVMLALPVSITPVKHRKYLIPSLILILKIKYLLGMPIETRRSCLTKKTRGDKLRGTVLLSVLATCSCHVVEAEQRRVSVTWIPYWLPSTRSVQLFMGHLWTCIIHQNCKSWLIIINSV
jgi:hypothetical protein